MVGDCGCGAGDCGFEVVTGAGAGEVEGATDAVRVVD